MPEERDGRDALFKAEATLIPAPDACARCDTATMTEIEVEGVVEQS